MTAADDIFARAVADASLPGQMEAPIGLLGLLQQEAEPINALLGHDSSNELFAAIEDEFFFIAALRRADVVPNTVEHERLVRLLRWIINGFQSWRRSADRELKELSALIVTARFCDHKDKLWIAFPIGLDANAELIDQLGRFVENRAITTSVSRFSLSPISDTESLERLQAADAGEDWSTFTTYWQSIEHGIFPDVVIDVAVRCLGRFGLGRLVAAVANTSQTLVANIVAGLLPVGQCLALGLATSNPRVQFASAYTAVSERRTRPMLESNEATLLTQLLENIAGDAMRWGRWMKGFNTFPVRFPALQKPLGSALATVSEPALQSYVEAIQLSRFSNSGNRAAVTECLRSFAAKANANQRQTLWRMCHDRWAAWQWELSADGHSALIQVGYSDIDYGVVGYAIECLDATSRGAQISALIDQSRRIEEGWYGSSVKFSTERNRVLSKLQPYAHADAIHQSNADWLTPTERHYLPFDPKTDHYIAQRYGTGSR